MQVKLSELDSKLQLHFEPELVERAKKGTRHFYKHEFFTSTISG